ncbi:vWA domain-containing protein [Pseudoduganella violacea]|uniref:Putative metal-dependent peptidase n=1 Tax=Pseudoduganella violacea TaxID=1715466 RepID=A0A7W5B809_9BURK|nr:VWA-like domain-containing protein [Pseudoduganella violacea]MBB3117495.1 putative metal-dependent peptidase [Pseudoduganella violacea]
MSKDQKQDSATLARQAGIVMVQAHLVLGAVAKGARICIDEGQHHVRAKGWVAVALNGTIWLHPKRRARPEEWASVIGIVLSCLGLGMVRQREPAALWEVASLVTALRFCAELKLGELPEEWRLPECEDASVESLFQRFCIEGCPEPLQAWYADIGGGEPLFVALDEKLLPWQRKILWHELLADGIARGVGRAIAIAGGAPADQAIKPQSREYRARRRMMDCYPLLGALAASFDLENDIRICQQYDIRVAAIDVGARRIWINPAAGLNDDETLFVLAHELLHAGLNHASRRRGRDHVLWNVACDFAINSWLIEMQVGVPPAIGLLYDAALAGQSADEIYDGLASDMRRARKLATLRGAGAPDLIGEDSGGQFADAEEYCRRALAQGMDRWEHDGRRGTVPAGLLEEIRSLAQPPIPWDARLAHWFDERFPPLEMRRSYARPSRRQGATPDIPRPSLSKPPEEERKSRVFAVLLDTSGSMEPAMLGKALGAIASYAMARDVIAVRLVCCDAAAYDCGWVEPENLLHRFTLRGRGGTVLQPGFDRLRELANQGELPAHGPVLVITDGWCEDRLETRMDHAYLMADGRRLPFTPRGEVFHITP